MLNLLKSSVKKVKEAPKWAKLLGLGALGGLGLYALRRSSNEEEQQEPQVAITPTETAKEASTPAAASAKTPTPASVGAPKKFSDPVNVLIGLAQYSAILGKEYDMVKQAYLQGLAKYQEQLDKMLPAITVLAMKTPLSALTNEDLPEKIRTMFQYSRFDVAIEQLPKLLKGYYIAKANGINTEALTETDLMTIADNPAFVQNVNENFIQVMSTIAEHIKLQMKTNLELIGKLKDEYKFKLDTLKATADFMKKLIDAYLKEKALEIQAYKARTDAAYKMSKLALDREKLQQKAASSALPQIEVK